MSFRANFWVKIILLFSDVWEKIYLELRKFYQNYNEIKLNHTLYPKEYLYCLPETLKTPISQMDLKKTNSKPSKEFHNNGIVGSFRKLEID